jgi:decaprenylphospho-beta-D-ribofuranose 2-oxidase
MGLTGIIKRARINMRKVETSKMNVTTLKTSNLEETIQKFTKLDTFFDYSVAWIDTMADGNSLGRSIISFGNHASLQDLEAEDKKNRYDVSSSRSINLPKYIPNGLLNKRTSKLFNDIWYRKSPRKKENEIQTIERFFYPLDFVKEWNRIYGNEGFLQYQIVIPEKNMFLISEIIETFSKVKCPIFLTVLKKMGNSNLGILSFPLKGWTLAFDIPAGFQDLNQILDKLDERIIEFGGRVYLAKDSRINSRVLREMYPRIDEFMSIRRKYDPNLVIQSDLARRLYL